MSGSKIQFLNEIKVLLLTRNNANRTALESMIGFGSQRISVESCSSIVRGSRALKAHQFNIVIICHSILEDKEIISFLQKTANVPVLIIDDYYNKARSEILLAAGALDYLDLSTLDSRLLIKSINFSIQQNNAEITARQAQRAMRMRSSFLANMSHEIRTPLNSIIGFSELLFEDETDPVKREKLNMIRQSGKHLLTLINSILDFSKLEAGKINIEKKEFSLDNLIQTLYYMMLVKSGDKNLDLNIKPVGIVPEMVTGDEFRLNQVLINLMNNAIKFTEKGSVTLEYGYENGIAMFSIIDTGIGIPADKIGHIFNAFEQVNSSEISSQSGTGLGLAISKSLVNLMQGKITVESEPDVGSRFKVTIPLQVSRWQMDKSESGSANHYPDRTLGIIYADDMQKEFMQDWVKKVNFDACWHDFRQGVIPVEFPATDYILLPQESYKEQYSDFLNDLTINSLISFKPKIFYSQRNSRLFFLITRNYYNSQLLEIPGKYLENNLKAADFINIINSISEQIEILGKKLISKWKLSFEQENPGLEEVLNEALLRLYDRNYYLNLALINNDYSQIEEIAHSLKGFTGQTCIFEVSNRASILLNEMRKKNPQPNVIQREISAINEIVWLLPRKKLGIKSQTRLPGKVLANLSEMKILIAEDNAINQAVLRDFLRHFELDCDLTGNGNEALDKLKENHYDLLFLDIQMPVLNGIETLKFIRSNAKLQGLYVVVITAYVSDHPEYEYLNRESDAFLTKPFEKKILLQILQKASDAIAQKNRKGKE
ncbi:MAG: response regulator [Candidatus Cloacimonetes bacterium]|nr:response regulator [Candidatus Cloacimonadota bacterium]